MNDDNLLEQIFDFDYQNKKHIESLKNGIDRTLPLIGTGMSIPFGSLSLNDLVFKLTTEWFSDTQEIINKVKNAIKNGTIHEEIDILDRNYFKGRIQSALEKHFIENQPDLSASKTRLNSFEKIINRINSLGIFGTQLILTTNYDNAIECIIDEMNKKKNTNINYDVFSPNSNNLSKLLDNEFSGKLKVLKFHGDYREKDTLVLTSDSFKNNYGITGDLNISDIDISYAITVNKILRKIIGNHSILFLGCSLNEDTFMKLFRSWLTHSMYPNYAILPKPNNENDIQILSRQALLMDISVIWIKENNYDWIDAIIEYVFTLSSIPSKPTGLNIVGIQGNSLIEINVSEPNTENDNESNTSEQNEENAKNNNGELTELTKFLQGKIRVIQVEPTKYAIRFPMHKIEGGLYEIYLVFEDGKYFITDEGTTYEELDKIYELKEPDVIKNIVAILKQYGCRKHEANNAFIIECTPQDIHIKTSFLIQAISFMLNMKIFYV